MSARTAKSKPNSQALPEAAFSFGAQPAAAWAAFAPFAAQAARGALMGVDGVEATLKFWRGLFDASRAMIRDQQDAALSAWGGQLADAAGAEKGAAAAGGQGFPWPMNAAAQSYEQMSNAFFKVQRDALEAFSHPDALH